MCMHQLHVDCHCILLIGVVGCSTIYTVQYIATSNQVVDHDQYSILASLVELARCLQHNHVPSWPKYYAYKASYELGLEGDTRAP